MVVMTNKFIVYSVTPYDPAGHRLRVSMQVPAPAPEGQELFMPAWIPGSYLIRDFARQVEIIRASSSGQAIGIRKTGNHTWVEIWDGGWHFIGAAEPDPNGLNHAWFVDQAKTAIEDKPENAIFAVSYRKTGTYFPLAWNPEARINAVNVTKRYKAR